MAYGRAILSDFFFLAYFFTVHHYWQRYRPNTTQTIEMAIGAALLRFWLLDHLEESIVFCDVCSVEEAEG